MSAAPQRVVLATGNRGKLLEIRELLAAAPVTIVPQSEFSFTPAEETGVTFAENALLKAEHAAAATGLMAIADDSGICVDALDGAPGVYTARYAGSSASDTDNIDKLLHELRHVPAAGRAAAFVCVVAIAYPGGERAPRFFTGEWRGAIAAQRSGSGGFGYDPVFLVPSLNRCAAELTAAEKNSRSHRGQAFRALAAAIGELL